MAVVLRCVRAGKWGGWHRRKSQGSALCCVVPSGQKRTEALRRRLFVQRLPDSHGFALIRGSPGAYPDAAGGVGASRKKVQVKSGDLRRRPSDRRVSGVNDMFKRAISGIRAAPLGRG